MVNSRFEIKGEFGGPKRARKILVAADFLIVSGNLSYSSMASETLPKMFFQLLLAQ